MRKRRASPVTRLDRCMRWQGLQSLKAESSLGLRGNIGQLSALCYTLSRASCSNRGVLVTEVSYEFIANETLWSLRLYPVPRQLWLYSLRCF